MWAGGLPDSLAMTPEPGNEARTAVSPDPFTYPLLEPPEGWKLVPSLSGWEEACGMGGGGGRALQQNPRA